MMMVLLTIERAEKKVRVSNSLEKEFSTTQMLER